MRPPQGSVQGYATAAVSGAKPLPTEGTTTGQHQPEGRCPEPFLISISVQAGPFWGLLPFWAVGQTAAFIAAAPCAASGTTIRP